MWMVLYSPSSESEASITFLCQACSTCYKEVWIKNYLKKHLCNQCSHYKKCGLFLLCKGSHHVLATLLPNQNFLLLAKINSTQSRILISQWRMHCTHYSIAKGTSQTEATSNNEKKQVHTFSNSQITPDWTYQVVSNYSVGRKSC